MKKLFGQHIYLGIWGIIFLAISIVFLNFDGGFFNFFYFGLVL